MHKPLRLISCVTMSFSIKATCVNYLHVKKKTNNVGFHNSTPSKMKTHYFSFEKKIHVVCNRCRCSNMWIWIKRKHLRDMYCNLLLPNYLLKNSTCLLLYNGIIRFATIGDTRGIQCYSETSMHELITTHHSIQKRGHAWRGYGRTWISILKYNPYNCVGR